jgi:hypothetical protein
MAEKVQVICPTAQAESVRQTNTTGSLRMAEMRRLPVGQTRGEENDDAAVYVETKLRIGHPV